MNRRTFLATLGSVLLPVPEPVRRYFFAPAGGWSPAHDCAIENITAHSPTVFERNHCREIISINGSDYDVADVEFGIDGTPWPRVMLTGEADAAGYINELLRRGRATLPPHTLRVSEPIVVPRGSTLNGRNATLLAEHTGSGIVAYAGSLSDPMTTVRDVTLSFVLDEPGECGLRVIPPEEYG